MLEEILPRLGTFLKKALISVFVTLNLTIICGMNLPDAWSQFGYFLAENFSGPTTKYRFQVTMYHVFRYANMVGLDNRWHMFGHQSRFNWHYIITGIYSDGKTTKEVALPDPRQMPRNFWQHNFTDFKEGKFHLILYGSEQGRLAYAYYLARTNPSADGLPIKQVDYKLVTQNIREPWEAHELGFHLDPDIQTRQLNSFPILLK